ncbi:MAG: hypothetical protein EOQ64_15525 [Mesorhizobium sp.]|uniref:hypothetical protein n=1 Tax=unclassified Mesorhizobium TaxID=325217 RepID=UPI000800EF32|nr:MULTISPECIES: hypothetical protein [unclassified Mesorhizobium]OBQ89974.1 hypothetical protein A9K66_15110 [Mesorhizobium sp. AA23]RWG55873.1 MAG: hypothetical protein EOQ64_15525 [Mesorhizobium sp.]RWH44936.1 MAG: hypothetical protein EOQ78_08370 [Mesorhizobium sp.]
MSSIRDLSYEHQMVIEAMKSQLIIALVRRLGNKVEMPVAEIDSTGSSNLTMKAVDGVFTFEVVDKKR